MSTQESWWWGRPGDNATPLTSLGTYNVRALNTHVSASWDMMGGCRGLMSMGMDMHASGGYAHVSAYDCMGAWAYEVGCIRDTNSYALVQPTQDGTCPS